MSKFVVVTFATTSADSRFRDYSEKLENLKLFLMERGIEFLCLNPREIINSEFYTYQNKFFLLRKGAGFWHWKPVAILEATKRFPAHTVLYLDVDVDVISLDVVQLISKSQSHPILAFKTLSQIQSWTSAKCLNTLDPDLEFRLSPLFVAAIILIQSGTSLGRDFLLSWISAMDNHHVLLDDRFNPFSIHRHDQSVFSLLAAKSPHIVQDLGPGFWGHGIDCDPIDLKDVWIGTSLSKFGQGAQPVRLKSRVKTWLSKIRNLIDIWIYCAAR